MYLPYAEQLVKDGFAYYAFDTTEELVAMRERMKAAGVPSPQYNAITRSTMQKLFGASEEKRAMGRNQMNRARASMGMKKGGRVKGKCKVDGIAIRGRTRAMHK